MYAIRSYYVYSEDLTHIITEEGIAHLVRCRTPEEREQAIRGVAGYTPVGMGRDKRAVENRITSYNVCYTKLLRCTRGTPR